MAAKQDLDPDFVICARCDLIGAEGGSFEAAVERCIYYVEEAGVDLIWLNNIQTAEECRIAAERIPGPVIPHFAGPPPARVVSGVTIGITKAADLPWRFCDADSVHVSRPWPEPMRGLRGRRAHSAA